MKSSDSDFQGEFKAYRVTTDNGNAYQPEHYGRSVDIGSTVSVVLSSTRAQAIYGDTHALRLVNPEKWPGKVTLQEAKVRLITLSFTFNEIVQMGAALSAQHGGRKLSDIQNEGTDKISRLFAECARNENLAPLGRYYVSSRSLLESFVPNGRDLPELEDGMEDACMECPNETVAQFTDAASILPDLHCMALFNEGDFPGYASKNRYYVSGLFTEGFRDAKLPIGSQDGECFPKVMAELHRTMK